MQNFLLFEDANNGGGSVWSIVIMIGLAVLMILIFILPQSKQKKKAKEMLSKMTVGDTLTTVGGIVGEIKEINDAEGTLVIETGSGDHKTTMKIIRGAVYQVAPKATDDGMVEVVDENYTEVVGEAPVMKKVKKEEIAGSKAEISPKEEKPEEKQE